MCGISGWFRIGKNEANSASQIKKMMATIKHRGPDAEGYKLFEHAALGHVRLSIIDARDGSQPLSHPDYPVTIIFNGEIYNYLELRETLILKGFHFISHSDTEVILALYILEGIKGINRLRGMYAFAIWDEQKQCGYLVRDPIGIKPLFYSKAEDKLIFASEAKAICSVSSEVPAMSESSLHLLMNFRYIPGDKSLFKNIYQLKPGQILKWQFNKLNVFNIANNIDTGSMDLHGALQDSVQHHLVSDVPLSSYLSGGIDSSLITQLAKEVEPSIETYTLAVGDDPKEAEYARETAKIFHISNQQSDFDLDVSKDLKKLIWHLEVPKINALQSYHLAQFAAQQHKVVLSGLGGDELFFGYNVHQIFYYLVKLNKVPKVMRNVIPKFLMLLNQQEQQLFSEKFRMAQMVKKLPQWHNIYALLRNVWDAPALRAQIYDERMLDQHLSSPHQFIQENWNNEIHPILAFREFEWKNKMVNDLLWHEDRCSMAHGLEVRVPFLDLPLKSLVWNFTLEELFPYGKKKYLLKKIAKAHLPESILRRPKSGFQVNAPVFFNQHLRLLSEEYLNYETTRKHRLFNYKFIKTVMQFPEKKQYRWHYFMLYLMLMTHLWLEQFESGQ